VEARGLSGTQQAQRRYVAVAGTIGAGKTSLVSWLERTYGLAPYFEPNDENPYLADFYRDMKRWAFSSQMFFLAHKFALHQRFERDSVSAVIDRTIYEDAEIFARNLYLTKAIDRRDWAVYERLYHSIREALRPPDVLVAVTCSLRATKARIRQRGRDMEQAIPDAYLRRLHRRYEEWFANYDLSPIVHIDTTSMDYVEDLVDLIELRRKMDRVLGATR
jgi:deoxyadenosine/deoxycytidine kinase